MLSIPFVSSDASPFLVLWVLFLAFLGLVLATHIVLIVVRLLLHWRVTWLLNEYFRSR